MQSGDWLAAATLAATPGRPGSQVAGPRQPPWLPIFTPRQPPGWLAAATWLARGSRSRLPRQPPWLPRQPPGWLAAATIASRRAPLDVVIRTLRVPLARPATTLTTARPTTRSTEDTRAQQLLEVSLRRGAERCDGLGGSAARDAHLRRAGVLGMCVRFDRATSCRW